MAVADGSILRAVLNATGVQGQEVKNVFTFIVDKVSIGTWSDAETVGFVADYLENAFLDVDQDITADMTFDSIDLYKQVTGDWDFLINGDVSITPTNATTQLADGVAALATGYTLINKVMGRKFLYGYGEDTAQGGLLLSAVLGRLGDFAADYITQWSGGTMGPLDYLVPGVYSEAVAAFRAFSGTAIVTNVLSYQRRRKPGVGA